MTEKRFVLQDLDILCRVLDDGKPINGIETVHLLNKFYEENEELKEKLESLNEIINNQIYEVKHTHKNCKNVGIAELKKLKKVLICNSIIDGDVE